jgi:hypothetical protein
MDQGISTEPVGYKRPPRARRWKPGQSGNPKGRPPGSGVTDRLRAILDDETAEAIAQAIIARALAGDHRMIALILNRTEGPVKQRVETSTVQHIKVYDAEERGAT